MGFRGGGATLGPNTFQGDQTFQGAIDHNGTTVGFYGATPVVRPPAYTQAYVGSVRSNPVMLFTTFNATTTNVGPWGFSSQAEADNCVSKINTLGTDIAEIKRCLNAIIDDQQAIGILQ